jgi:hypothetical protein
LAKSSCERLPVQLIHEIEKKKKEKRTLSGNEMYIYIYMRTWQEQLAVESLIFTQEE